MYRISQLMSTPVASTSWIVHWCENLPFLPILGLLPLSVTQLRRRNRLCGKSTCFRVSVACGSLDGDSSFDCCSIDPLTGSYLPCRRSPRLLTNGYYIWTEDSFLCDRDGNMTLSPSQTSVMYKENSVRIFRKKKRIRRSFSSLFNLRASKSWLHGSIFGDVDSSPGEDIWLEGVSRLDMHHCNENGQLKDGYRVSFKVKDQNGTIRGKWKMAKGGDCDGSLTGDWESEKPRAESVKASSSGHVTPETPRKSSHGLSLQSQLMASDHLQGNVLDHSKTSVLGEISFQTILLAACLIVSACARWFLGGMLTSAFTCSFMVTVAYVVRLLFLSLASFLKPPPVLGECRQCCHHLDQDDRRPKSGTLC